MSTVIRLKVIEGENAGKQAEANPRSVVLVPTKQRPFIFNTKEGEKIETGPLRDVIVKKPDRLWLFKDEKSNYALEVERN